MSHMLSLHTAKPVGTDSSNEVAYPGYARQPVRLYDVPQNHRWVADTVNDSQIIFPKCTSGDQIATYWVVGDGTGAITDEGAITPPLEIKVGVTPKFPNIKAHI